MADIGTLRALKAAGTDIKSPMGELTEMAKMKQAIDKQKQDIVYQKAIMTTMERKAQEDATSSMNKALLRVGKIIDPETGEVINLPPEAGSFPLPVFIKTLGEASRWATEKELTGEFFSSTDGSIRMKNIRPKPEKTEPELIGGRKATSLAQAIPIAEIPEDVKLFEADPKMWNTAQEYLTAGKIPIFDPKTLMISETKDIETKTQAVEFLREIGYLSEKEVQDAVRYLPDKPFKTGLGKTKHAFSIGLPKFDKKVKELRSQSEEITDSLYKYWAAAFTPENLRGGLETMSKKLGKEATIDDYVQSHKSKWTKELMKQDMPPVVMQQAVSYLNSIIKSIEKTK